MTRKHAVVTDRAAPAAGPYSQAVKWGSLVFTASVGALRPGQDPPQQSDVRAYANNTLENLKAVLDAAGSSMDHLLKVTMYLRDPQHLEDVNAVYTTFVGGVLPARSIVVTSGSSAPVSFDAIAYVPDSASEPSI